MKPQFFVFLFSALLTSTTFASTVQTAGHTVACRPNPEVTQPYFESLTLKIDSENHVTGSYKGYQAAEGSELSLIESKPSTNWMKISGIKQPRLDAQGNLVVQLDFKGSAGDDEDLFVVRINQETGISTIGLSSKADCGDGNVEVKENQAFTCWIQ